MWAEKEYQLTNDSVQYGTNIDRLYSNGPPNSGQFNWDFVRPSVMAGYVPSTRIPIVNVCQELQNYRGHEINDEVDVIIPPYLFDRRILRAIEFKNMKYVEGYLRRCPRNIERYFFLETVSSVSPMIRSIIVSNLLGYAFLYRSIPCVKYLLDLAADPFQPAYFIDWASYNENQRKITLYEAPSVILISGSIHERYRKECIDMLSLLRTIDVELHLPVALRRQQFEPPNEPLSSSLRFNDTWECWEKEIEKRRGDDLTQSKSFMRELKTVYRANKFERLNAPS